MTETISPAAQDLLDTLADDIEAAGLGEANVLAYDREPLAELHAAGLVSVNEFHGTITLTKQAAVSKASLSIKGYVEQHDDGAVSGWAVYEDTCRRDQPVKLGLYWGDLLLRSVHTSRERPDIGRGWGNPRAGFQFPLRSSLLALLPTGTSLQVKTSDGLIVPMLKDFRPVGRATDDGAALLEKLEAGFHVDHWGAMKLPFGKDEQRRGWYADALRLTIDHFAVRYGKVLFPYFGTLLGLVREGKFLDHDDDVDTAYISRGTTVEEVAAEFHMIARDLIAQGHTVDVVCTGQMNVQLKGSDRPGVDVFSAWVTAKGEFFSFPSAGGMLRSPLLFQEVDFEGYRFIIPEDAEHFVEFAYGPSWRTPDPTYQLIIPRSLAATMKALNALVD